MFYIFEHEKINTCDDCPLLDGEQGCYCMLSNGLIRKNPGVKLEIPDWCMLKESEGE